MKFKHEAARFIYTLYTHAHTRSMQKYEKHPPHVLFFFLQKFVKINILALVYLIVMQTKKRLSK